jgi:3-oxoacyl-[acyl-carrier-protein] synthase III
MANFKINNVRLSGIGCIVPKAIQENIKNNVFHIDDIEKFIITTGVSEFRKSGSKTTTADLGVCAAEKLMRELKIDRDEIDILIFVSQTPDYNCIPNTAPIMQARLGLKESCLAFDIPLGCSGYIYGLSTVASYLQNGAFKKALLICGDTPSKIVSENDKSSAMLFGDAASVTLLEYSEGNDMYFNLGTDGSGFETIKINDGGFRNPFTQDSLIEKDFGNDIKRNGCQLILDGMDVFGFGINQAPKTFNELLSFSNVDKEQISFSIFHQANLMMNEMIRKKLKLNKETVPYSLEKFGNTSSASIPLTIVTKLKDKIVDQSKLVLCGFGVGLSWGTCYLEANNLTIMDLIEYE